MNEIDTDYSAGSNTCSLKIYVGGQKNPDAVYVFMSSSFCYVPANGLYKKDVLKEKNAQDPTNPLVGCFVGLPQPHGAQEAIQGISSTHFEIRRDDEFYLTSVATNRNVLFKRTGHDRPT